jgi:hypothetical protein
LHPPPKVTQQAIPQKDHTSKETLRVSARLAWRLNSHHASARGFQLLSQILLKRQLEC